MIGHISFHGVPILSSIRCGPMGSCYCVTTAVRRHASTRPAWFPSIRLPWKRSEFATRIPTHSITVGGAGNACGPWSNCNNVEPWNDAVLSLRIQESGMSLKNVKTYLGSIISWFISHSMPANRQPPMLEAGVAIAQSRLHTGFLASARYPDRVALSIGKQ